MFKPRFLVFMSTAIIAVTTYAAEEINISSNKALNENTQEIRNILMNPIIHTMDRSPIISNAKNDNADKGKNKSDITNNAQTMNLADSKINDQENPVYKPKVVRMFPTQMESNREKNEYEMTSSIATTPIQIEKKLIRNMPINANYNMNKRNYISESGINAIVAPVKITSFVPEPNSVNFQWINDHRGIAFQLKDNRKTFQAIVTFESNQNPVSIFFDVINVPGRVISIPSDITGLRPFPKESPLSLKKEDNYEKYIVEIMNDIVSGKSLNDSWQYQESQSSDNPYNEIAVKSYKHWFNDVYSIKDYQLCSQTSEFVNLSEKTFTAPDTIAITITKHKLNPSECTQVVVMSEKQKNDSQATDTYTPGQEK